MRIVASTNLRRSLLATGLLVAAGPVLAQGTGPGAGSGVNGKSPTTAHGTVQPVPAARAGAPSAPQAMAPAAPQAATSPSATAPVLPHGTTATTSAKPGSRAATTDPVAKPTTVDRHDANAPTAPATSASPARTN